MCGKDCNTQKNADVLAQAKICPFMNVTHSMYMILASHSALHAELYLPCQYRKRNEETIATAACNAAVPRGCKRIMSAVKFV